MNESDSIMGTDNTVTRGEFEAHRQQVSTDIAGLCRTAEVGSGGCEHIVDMGAHEAQ